MDIMTKLELLTAAAKYDVACTSSGVDRDARLGHLGSTTCAGICHSFSADGRCITLLKVLLTNHCLYDCAYCANRSSNDIPRVAFRPQELAELTMAFYRRNYIEGLFLSSGIVRSPDYTMELLCRTLSILRESLGFQGYIHAKAIPGASEALIGRLGSLADRLSVNIELPSERSMRVLAPDKSHLAATAPMGIIASKVAQDRVERGSSRRQAQRFAPAGQSTQLIIGASPETDLDILTLSSSLYRRYELKHVFFSAYLPHNDDALLPGVAADVPLDREHRLYQADWLMRFYGFDASEIVDEEHPFLDPLLDPKVSWALQHPELFPVELNTAPYEMLLRVPGLGVRGAKRLMRARRHVSLTHDSITKLRLQLKRMQYFITCSGRYRAPLAFEPELIRSRLISDAISARARRRGGPKLDPGQMSLFEEPQPLFGSLSGTDDHVLAGEVPYQPFQREQLRAFAAQERRLESLGAAASSGSASAYDPHTPHHAMSLAAAAPAPRSAPRLTGGRPS